MTIAPSFMDDFVRGLVDLANRNNAGMDGTMAPVLQLVAEHDLVFAVWQDSAAPHGVGVLIVKGANRLREIATGSGSVQVRVTAISCIAAEQAEALRQHVAADPTH
jgi:hypothetical protein